MACHASGRTQIAPVHKRGMMNACVVEREFIRGNLVTFHIFRIRMAGGASLRHIQWIDSRSRVIRRLNIVNPVAINADGDFGVALGHQFSVHARQILRVLVRSQRGIETTDVAGIRMALRTETGNLFSFQMPFESRRSAHGYVRVVRRRVAAVAGHASHAFLRVNTCVVFVRAGVQRRIKLRVAIQTGILHLLRERHGPKKQRST